MRISDEVLTNTWSYYNGDINTQTGKACDDLTIGIPDEDLTPAADAGRAYTIYGGTTGLSTTGDLVLHQNITGVAGDIETDDRFGARMQASDRDHDGYDDLVAIVPGDGCSAGLSVGAHVFYGSSSGLVVSGNELLCEDYTCRSAERATTTSTQARAWTSRSGATVTTCSGSMRTARWSTAR